MSVYSTQIESAQRLIREKGAACIYKQLRGGNVSDINKPWQAGETIEVEFPVEILLLPFNLETKKFFSYMTGTETPKGNFMGLMGAVSFEPRIKDVVVQAGKQYTIQNFDLLAPNGDPILYTFELSQGSVS